MNRIEDCLSFYLGKAYQRVNQAAKSRLAPFGVTPAQYAILKVLWERDGQSSAHLGERLALDSATITGLIDRLEHARLIERRPHATDRRVNVVTLTPQGRDLQAPLDHEMDAMNRDFLGDLPGDDAQQLRRLLAVITAREDAAPGR